MPAMLFAGALYRGHGTGRPRRSYECPRAIARMQSGLLFATFRYADTPHSPYPGAHYATAPQERTAESPARRRVFGDLSSG